MILKILLNKKINMVWENYWDSILPLNKLKITKKGQIRKTAINITNRKSLL